MDDSPSKVTLRVDRYALAEIASDKTVLGDEHALVFGRSEFIEPEDLPNSVTERKSSNAAGSFDARVHDLKRTLVERAVVDAAGDFEVAAATLGLSSSYLRRLARSLNVKLP